MEFPAELKYSDTDEWVRIEDQEAALGVTDFAQDQLSDIVYFEVTTAVGDQVSKGDPVAVLESVKAASDIYSPASGEIVAVNEALPDTPELVNTDPYGEAWMVKIRLSDPTELDGLMDNAAYEQSAKERGG